MSTAKFASRSFIITLLWIGFILAISFMEAPLKFRAPSLTLPVGLEIGHLVFHMLNRIEIVFGILTAVSLVTGAFSHRVMLAVSSVLFLLFVQTVLLYTQLDTRTLAIINGQSVTDAPYHIYYIVMEFIKLILLCMLAHFQLKDYRIALLSEAAKSTC